MTHKFERKGDCEDLEAIFRQQGSMFDTKANIYYKCQICGIIAFKTGESYCISHASLPGYGGNCWTPANEISCNEFIIKSIIE